MSLVKETLARLWSELLADGAPGPARPLGSAASRSDTDDFFELGGHSLLAARLSARIRTELGAELQVRDVYEAPTLGALAARVEAKGGAPVTTIAPLPRGEPLRASPMQERLWVLSQLDPGSSAYVMQLAYRLRGPLDVPRLARAFEQLVVRHEGLRSIFTERDGVPFVTFLPPYSPLPATAAATVERARADTLAASFDVARGPLVRASIASQGPDDHMLFVAVHHIVSDGWSEATLLRELSALYRGEELTALPYQYADYAAWHRARLDGGALARDLSFWREALAGAPPFLTLPTARPRRAGASLVALSARRIGREATDAIDALARAHGASRYMVLLGAYAVVLGRLAGQSDVVIATPSANRPEPAAERIAGFFMNTLAVRVQLGKARTGDELLAQVRERVLAALAHQDAPFEKVVIDQKPPRDVLRSPIAQVALNVMNFGEATLELGPDITAEPIRGAPQAAKFDLNLYVRELDGGLDLELAYDGSLFDEPAMRRLLADLDATLAELAAGSFGSDEPPHADDALPDPTASLRASPGPTVLERFLARAAETPDALAVTDAQRRWSYAELRRRSLGVAAWLAGHGVGPGDTVVVHAERNALTVVALLGVLAAGAAFVVFDADYPLERLTEQHRVARPKAWIGAVETPAARAACHPLRGATALDVVDATADEGFEPVAPGELAYVVFTSGTTGKPKGIRGGHGPLSHFIEWHAEIFGLGSTDRFSAISGLAHDPFLRDVFTPLSVGASLHLPNQDDRVEPERLVAWLAREGVTVSHLTPSLAEVLSVSSRTAPSLRAAFFSGEPLRAEHLRALRRVAPRARFVNFYGTTETPQAMASFIVEGEPVDPIPIGRGIDGVQLLVLDATGRQARAGEIGELFVRTPHLALGYVGGEPGGFGRNPFGDSDDDRIYRTGDRARVRPDGNVVVLGRIDAQVKVRGFRVELGEVEGALRAHPRVRHAAILFDEQRRALAGYAVADDVTARDLSAFMRERLPDYMVPSTLHLVGSIPLTPNGKVDRERLRAAARATGPGEKAESDGFAPANDVETTIMEIWKGVLGLERLRRDVTFAELGGNAASAQVASARMSEALGVAVQAADVTGSTVASAGAHVVDQLFDF